jgi:hypothetical protein
LRIIASEMQLAVPSSNRSPVPNRVRRNAADPAVSSPGAETETSVSRKRMTRRLHGGRIVCGFGQISVTNSGDFAGYAIVTT